MANKFLARYKNDEEENYIPRQRGLGRRVFEGISKKAKKRWREFKEDELGIGLSRSEKEWTEPPNELSPQNPKDWREMRARRARDLERGRPPTYEDAEKYMEETNRKLKKRAK